MTDSEHLPEDVIEALSRGGKIDAIKRLREAEGGDLKSAKQQVDAYLAAHPELFPARRTVAFNPLPLIAAAIIAAAVYYLTR